FPSRSAGQERPELAGMDIVTLQFRAELLSDDKQSASIPARCRRIVIQWPSRNRQRFRDSLVKQSRFLRPCPNSISSASKGRENKILSIWSPYAAALSWVPVPVGNKRLQAAPIRRHLPEGI